MDKLVDAEELAGVLGLTKAHVYRLTRRGEIPYYEFGKYYRYEPSEVKKSRLPINTPQD